MSPEQYLVLARRSGATVYTNRHYPHQPAVSFSNAAWLKFCDLLATPAAGTPQSVVSEDPCPGCRAGAVCRTPSCGRLAKENMARIEQINQRLDQSIDAFNRDEHDSLTFHKLPINRDPS